MARDAGDVLASNRKMWRAMFERHGLTPTNPAALDAFLTAALDAAATALGWCEAHLPAAQWALVRHETLASAPHDTTRAICRHLLPESVVDESALARAVQRTGAGRIERHATGRAEGPAARSAIERLDAAQARSADRFAPAQT
jgi:hypothetical protein